MKRILTMDDLVQFCVEQGLMSFSAKETGYPLSVQIPATFDVEPMEQKEMLRLKFRALHLGRNRNGSNVSRESADAAKPSFAGRPILAHIHELDDGSFDFGAHEIEEEDGEVVYVEKQVGSLTGEEPFYETADDKEYLCCYGLIPTRYTKAAEIIEAKGGTKVSVELCIEEMAYDAKEKQLDLKSWYLTGITLLGKEDDGTEIGEGMLGARADIVDFSEENNSLFARLDKIESVLSDLTIKSFGEGGKEAPMKFEELLEQYGVTAEDVTFEYEGMSDEELEAAFKEAFASPSTSAFMVRLGEDSRSFELSLEEKANALYQLVNTTYGDEDNEWYTTDTFEDHVVFHGFFSGKHFKQDYEQNGDEFALVGERVEVYAEYLTQAEVDALNLMRSTYDALKQYKDNAEEAKLNDAKDAALAEFKETLKESKDYQELVDHKADFTVDEIRDKCFVLVGKNAMTANFSATEETGVSKVGFDFNAKPEERPYGMIFE